MVEFQHFQNRNSFGDTDNQFNSAVSRLANRKSCEFCGNENYRALGTGFICGFFNSIEDRKRAYFVAAFSRSDTSLDLCSIFEHLLRVEGAISARDPLDDDSCFAVY